MTAIDRLIEMLGERGVDYVIDEEFGKRYPPEKSVTWSCEMAGESMTVTARDYCVGTDPEEYCLDLEFHEAFTPEQAIEATCGRGECHIEERHGDWYCTKCNEMVGTFDTTSELYVDGNAVAMWNHCPNCGAKVVRV